MNFRKIKNFTIKYACILTTGRTGSDYLQGCLDGVRASSRLVESYHFLNF